jgi:hypothetical protein
VLSSLKHKYAASDAKASEENSKLTDEYKRITEQFKDLQVRRSAVLVQILFLPLSSRVVDSNAICEYKRITERITEQFRDLQLWISSFCMVG